MALSVAFWRLGTRAIRVVTAATAGDDPTVDVPPGAMLYRMDTGEHRYCGEGSNIVQSVGGWV